MPTLHSSSHHMLHYSQQAIPYCWRYYLQMSGPADPTGRGFGYSFIRDIRHKVRRRRGGEEKA